MAYLHSLSGPRYSTCIFFLLWLYVQRYVWHIYLHFCLNLMVNVCEYTIHCVFGFARLKHVYRAPILNYTRKTNFVTKAKNQQKSHDPLVFPQKRTQQLVGWCQIFGRYSLLLGPGKMSISKIRSHHNDPMILWLQTEARCSWPSDGEGRNAAKRTRTSRTKRVGQENISNNYVYIYYIIYIYIY